MRISIAELTDVLSRALDAAGLRENPRSVARSIALAERDDDRHNGFARLRDYVETLRSGWVDGRASPVIAAGMPGIIGVDAADGFAQPALERVEGPLLEKARRCGIALLAMRNSHHYSALWPDVLPYAERGLLALAFVNSRSRVAPYGGVSKLFGTNPMAFACPRSNGPPVVWDQASSVMSAMRLIAAGQRGEPVPHGVGLDRRGQPTTDPESILDGGAQLPFGGHKGSMIALTIEIMAGALTGARFGFEDESGRFPGARTSNAGLSMIVIDPAAISPSFSGRVGELCSRLEANGDARVPGSLRRSYAASEDDEVTVQDSDYRYALSLLGSRTEG